MPQQNITIPNSDNLESSKGMGNQFSYRMKKWISSAETDSAGERSTLVNEISYRDEKTWTFLQIDLKPYVQYTDRVERPRWSFTLPV
jgi:hypothetical protein